MNITTPKGVSVEVRRFCRELSSVEPCVLPVQPRDRAKPLECFFNVADAARDGEGSPVFGFLVWEFEGHWLEAERHAVLRRTTGAIEDITPHLDGEKSILFVEDPTWSFDVNNPAPTRRPERWLLSDEPMVKQWAGALDRLDMFKFRNGRFVGRHVDWTPRDEKSTRHYQRIGREVQKFQTAVLGR
ncbi:hypothetical protein [Marivivens marinus]|uniref:hypothetical protein n=1 Tax=Marivivens marinus TaxID=3110173 RepID=UPI003B8450B2